MTDDEEIRALVKTLKTFKLGKVLKHYIAFAQFPRFKSIEPGTRVNFEFPLTALVGANGSGKSSLLHALWGMPYGNSTSKFWFSTDLDPIEENQKDLQRYFYGHWSDSFDGVVETRKARVGKKKGNDYWEPYRSSVNDGMSPMPAGEFEGKAKDRWNPVRRKVVYINLKATFGSFDRYFYFDDGFDAGSEKREAMLKEARRIKVIKEENRQSYKLGGIERVFENRDLTEDEVSAVSKILGRPYESARIIRHSLYLGNRGRDLSVIFKRGSVYSEAYAGSGEVAAVSVVVQILNAQPYSLILLDEPETSLHPGAQRALLRFLLEQIKLHKHQVVLSTHSSDFLEGLPHEAIKVFEDNGNFQSRIIPRSSPSAALKRLGRTATDKKRILVEDRLAALLVSEAIKSLDPGDADALEIKVAPGGAESILKYLGSAAMVSGDKVFVLLDGDKKKVESFTRPEDITPAQYKDLNNLVKSQVGFDPIYHIPGGADVAGHEAAKIQAHLDYLRWLRAHVDFLPRKLPEHILLEGLDPGQNHSQKSPSESKLAFRRCVSDGVEVELDSNEIIALAKVKVAKIPKDNVDLNIIREKILRWLHE